MAGRVLAALVCVAGLAGCDFRPSAPESRAGYFVEKLVVEPEAAEDLRAVAWLAEDQSPEVLIGDIPTRTAIVFLRARTRLGHKPGFHLGETTRPAPEKRTVFVYASEGGTVGKAETVRFQVEMELRDNEWRVVRLQAD